MLYISYTQYLGKLKRHMFLAELQTTRLPLPGDELVTSGKQEIDGSGKVVDAAFDAEGTCQCLYIAQIAKAQAGKLNLLKQPDITIDNIDLHYSLEN